MRRRRILLCLAAALAWAAPALAVWDWGWGFNWVDASGDYTGGPEPFRVRVQGGRIRRASTGEDARDLGLAYGTSEGAWLLDRGEAGTLTFLDVPAKRVILYLKNQSESVSSLLTIRDVSGAPVFSLAGNASGPEEGGFTKVDVAPAPGDPLIGEIDWDNGTGPGAGLALAALDEMTYSPHLPSAAAALVQMQLDGKDPAGVKRAIQALHDAALGL